MTQAIMANNLAALFSPRNFKAQHKDPEHVSSDFNLYLESFFNFLTVIDGGAAWLVDLI